LTTGRITSIVEKSRAGAPSKFGVTGIFVYDADVFDVIPSWCRRGRGRIGDHRCQQPLTSTRGRWPTTSWKDFGADGRRVIDPTMRSRLRPGLTEPTRAEVRFAAPPCRAPGVIQRKVKGGGARRVGRERADCVCPPPRMLTSSTTSREPAWRRASKNSLSLPSIRS